MFKAGSQNRTPDSDRQKDSKYSQRRKDKTDDDKVDQAECKKRIKIPRLDLQ